MRDSCEKGNGNAEEGHAVSGKATVVGGDKLREEEKKRKYN